MFIGGSTAGLPKFRECGPDPILLFRRPRLIDSDPINRRVVFEAIRELMTPPEPKRRPIGFVTPKEK
jgi:hypothetical protein